MDKSVIEAQAAAVELERQKARNESTPTPAPASETPPRSRSLTEYVILIDNGAGAQETARYVRREETVQARTPEAAIESAPTGTGADTLVAIPLSSWHEFEKTTAWKKR